MRYRLNRTRPRELLAFEPPGPGDFPSIRCKNVPWPGIRQLLPSYVNRVLGAMDAAIEGSPSRSLAYRLVDVKVHDLTPGRETANGLWHLDCSLDPSRSFDNLLFVSGRHALTEFINEPLDLESLPSAGSFHRAVVDRGAGPVERVPSCVVVRYDGTNVHRGPRSLGTERRLLVRMVATSVSLPRSPPRRIF